MAFQVKVTVDQVNFLERMVTLPAVTLLLLLVNLIIQTVLDRHHLERVQEVLGEQEPEGDTHLQLPASRFTLLEKPLDMEEALLE